MLSKLSLLFTSVLCQEDTFYGPRQSPIDISSFGYDRHHTINFEPEVELDYGNVSYESMHKTPSGSLEFELGQDGHYET